MLAIKGIYDGTVIKPLEHIPVKEEVEVIITFLDDIQKTKSGKDWRNLRGSARGENLLETLLRDRQEDLNREG
jgi:predicted DNA-binding antitoxin AbrB/MazE fold protein